MNTLSTSQDPSGQPAPAARRPRRPRLLRRTALAVTCLAGVGGCWPAIVGHPGGWPRGTGLTARFIPF